MCEHIGLFIMIAAILILGLFALLWGQILEIREQLELRVLDSNYHIHPENPDVLYSDKTGLKVDYEEVAQAYADKVKKETLLDFVKWFNDTDKTQGIIELRINEYLNQKKN